MLLNIGKTKVNYTFLLILSLFLLLVSPVAYSAGCCVASYPNSPEAHCTEYDTESEAINGGCAPGGFQDGALCEYTQCGDYGCCLFDCTWKERSSCYGSFMAFEECELQTQCVSSCCIVGNTPIEGQMTEPECAEYSPTPGDYRYYYNMSCDEVGMSDLYGSLRGIITDRDTSEALNGVEVHAGSYMTVTDVNGEYLFESILTGTYNLVTYMSSYQQYGTESAVVLDGQITVEDIEMVAYEEAVVTINGKVTDNFDNPLNSVSIILGSQYSAFTDSLGNYVLKATIPVGTYNMIASKNGYNSDTLSIAIEPGNVYSGNDFVLTEAAVETRCGDGVRQSGEECDGPDSAACPGQCAQPGTPDECTCPLTCEDMGYYCADFEYQCEMVNGRVRVEYNDDCAESNNYGQGVCCNTLPMAIPICLFGEAPGMPTIGDTDVETSGGSYCKCGNYFVDTASRGNEYCCLLGNERIPQVSECITPGSLKGNIVDDITGTPIVGVTLLLSSIYHTVSTSGADNFRFDNVAPGQYTITATKVGYQDYSGAVQVLSGQEETFNIRMIPYSGSSDRINVGISAVKGEEDVMITITPTSTSTITTYRIFKNGQVTPIEIISPIGQSDSFIDSAVDWDTTYTYNVTAYASDGSVVDSKVMIFSTGNSACDAVYDENEFCASETCFLAKSSDQCGSNDESPYKYRAKCNNNNKLVYATGSRSSSECGENCIQVNQYLTVCKGEEEDSCEGLGLPPLYSSYTSNLGNIFGLFYDESYGGETCTMTANSDYKFCYYDYYVSDVLNRDYGSYTSVDQCISCSSVGFCYDYQSEGACLIDNCKYGPTHDTECKWYDTHQELGKGICYSDDVASTNFCALCDTNKHPLFYNIECTQNICDMLGNCVANDNNDKCLGCTLASECMLFDGDQQACLGASGGFAFTGQPQLAYPAQECGSSTVIEYSDDSCSIGLCRYDGSNCLRDTNLDGQDDCDILAEGNSECIEDRTPPTTSVDVLNYMSTVMNSIYFTVNDNYADTYYCFSDEGDYCCPNKLVDFNTITIPNTDYNFVNMEENKIFWFYSTTQYGNPEPIEYRSLYIDTKAPQLDVHAEVVDSSLGVTLSDIIITIVSHESAVECNDQLSGMYSGTRLVNDRVDTVKEVTYAGLSDGNYIYHIVCKDIYGNVNSSVYVDIELDRIQLIKKLSPNGVTLANSSIDFSLETEQKSYYCYNQLRDFNFQTQLGNEDLYTVEEASNNVFKHYLRNVPHIDSGTYGYSVQCYEDSGRSDLVDQSYIMFTIDKVPPVTELYIKEEGGYQALEFDKYYNNPMLKINCSDSEQGPPREFGCSKINYCIAEYSCMPSSGQSIGADSIEFTPQVETGSYYVCYESFDRGGNQDPIKCNQIHFDMDVPTITITSPFNNEVKGTATFIVRGSWNDEQEPAIIGKVVNTKTGLQRNVTNIAVTGGTTQGTYSGSLSLNDLFGGRNTLTMTAIDPSDNYKSTSVSFYYDIYPPDITQAMVYGEEYTVPGIFVLTGGSDIDILKEFVIASDNDVIMKHVEFGSRIKFQTRVNDYMYLDMYNIMNDEVTPVLDVAYAKNGSAIISELELIYNQSSGYYETIIEELLEVANYTATYKATDTLGYENDYTHSFYVNDTTPPYFEIRIFDSLQRNISNLVYGTYRVEVIASEPVADLHYLNYTVNGKTKSIIMLGTSGTVLEGILVLSQSDLDILMLTNKLAVFDILAEDLHGQLGTEIILNKQFYITTTGPMQPIILTPNTLEGTIFYSTASNYDVEGIVYEGSFDGLEDARIEMKKNNVFGDYSDSNWINVGETTTVANTYHEVWDYTKYIDEVTYKSEDTITLHDYGNYMQVGRYIGFRNHPTSNEKLYKIVSIRPAGSDGPAKPLSDIQVEPSLIGFGMNQGGKFQELIDVFDTDSPDGWFTHNVDIDNGNNFFYALPYEGPNAGTKSIIFNIIKDNLNPVLINTSPLDGTKTGNVNVPIYAYVDPTLSNVSNYTLIINNEKKSAVLTYNQFGEAKIEYGYSGSLDDGVYNASVNVVDMAGNTLDYQWQFEINHTMPTGAEIEPTGVISDTTPLVSIRFFENTVIDEADLSGMTNPYHLPNLTTLLSYDGYAHTYQLTTQQSLIEGEYKITVKARRVLGADDYGAQGEFIETFKVDQTPPIIVAITNPAHSHRLPVTVNARTNEPSMCKYSFYDLSYDDLEFTSTAPGFASEHVFQIYEIAAISTKIYVKCKDMADNKMLSPKIVDVSVDSPVYPAPKIRIPETTPTFVTSSNYEIVGSTFDEDNPLLWVPDINIVIGKSPTLHSVGTAFETMYNTRSFDTPDLNLVGTTDFIFIIPENAIIIRDEEGLFQAGKYVDFTENRKPDFTLYRINSAMDVSGSYGEFMVKASFNDELPSDLGDGQTIYVSDQEAPGGWFSYLIPLFQGNNFIYAAATNQFGEGDRSQIYNIIRDNTNPKLFDEYPRDGEVIGEQNLEISVIADGVYSPIADADFTLNTLPVSYVFEDVKDYETKISYDTTQSIGLHSVRVRAEDSGGNSAEKNWVFTIDTSVPSRPMIMPNTYINDTTPSVSVQFNDQVALNSIKVMGLVTIDLTNLMQNYNDMSFNHELQQVLAEGEYRVEVRAARKGDTSYGFWYERFYVDLTPPIITSIPVRIETTQMPVEFIMRTNEDAICRYSTIDRSFFDMEYTIDMDGVHKKIHDVSAYLNSLKGLLYIRCKDIAGNAMTTSKLVIINNDDPPVCGDGKIKNPEQCDGTNWGGIQTCTQLNPGYKSGNLECDNVSCVFDVSACVVCTQDSDCDYEEVCLDNSCYANHCLNYIQDEDETGIDCGGQDCDPCYGGCGDGIVDPGEQCDSDVDDKTCEDFNMVDGTLQCIGCYFDVSLCLASCGNGIIEDNEVCEEARTCSEFGLEGGDAPCVNCQRWDTSVCEGDPGVCGDLQINPGEQCDFTGERSCTEFSSDYVAGVYSCTASCNLDLSDCGYGGCGDSIIEQGELCDTNSLNGMECSDFDSFQGVDMLSCSNQCQFDTSNCIPPPQCGNGRVDPGESCDGVDFGPISNCYDLNPEFDFGDLTCMDDCHFNTTNCVNLPECGNAVLEDGEACDGDTANLTCEDFNMDNGLLECINCGLNTSNCLTSCGNNLIELGEQCDGDLDGKTCLDFGFTAGSLTCGNDCYFDTSYCIVDPECGNSVIELGETCDSGLDGKTCLDFDEFTDGSLVCDVDCNFDTLGCEKDPVCGNGVIDPGEHCDSSNFEIPCSQHDADLTGGSIRCTGSCKFDFSECIGYPNGYCGDGQTSDGEMCDYADEDPITMTCDDLSLSGGLPLSCTGACEYDTSHCGVKEPICGDGIVDIGEACDLDLDGKTCSDFDGFSGEGLQCGADCNYDTLYCLVGEPVCGNDVVEQQEQCEGGIGDKTCEDFDDFMDGMLACDGCLYNTSNCIANSPICGNNVIEPGEGCDGSNFGNLYGCTDLNPGYVSGQLVCDIYCQIDVSDCELPEPYCGNTIIEPGIEECDSSIADMVCTDFDDFVRGTLGCDENCQYDTSSCEMGPTGEACGNSVLNPEYGEECDKALSQSMDCYPNFDDYISGMTSCDEECRWDTSGCGRDDEEPYCGDGAIQPGEQCDSDTIMRSCRDFGFDVDGSPCCLAGGHSHECMYDFSCCGGTTAQCTLGDTMSCNDLNPLYIYGEAVCVDDFYDMVYCFTADYPIISISDVPDVVSVDYITIEGFVSSARKLEIYVNDVFVEEVEYNTAVEHEFIFEDIYLQKSTMTSDGINEIRLVASGGLLDRHTSFNIIVKNDQRPTTIEIIDPSNLITNTNHPVIIINTSKPAVCNITYDSFSDTYTQLFSSEDMFEHGVLIENTLTDNNYNHIAIKCLDTVTNQTASMEEDIFVDTLRPIINAIDINVFNSVIEERLNYKKVVIFTDMNNTIRATADSDVRCKYGINDDTYESMIYYDESEVYALSWESPVIESNLQSLKIYTICEDEAGWLTDTFELELDVRTDWPLEIRNMNPRYVNEQNPLIKVETNRPADCTLTYGSIEKEMAKVLLIAAEEHNIAADKFDGLRFEHDMEYVFEANCEAVNNDEIAPASLTIEIGADLEPPEVEITYPNNNDVFNTYEINVQVETEPGSNVTLYVNDLWAAESFTSTGSTVFDVILTNIENIITAVVSDKGGNEASDSITVYSTSEEQPPYVTGTFPDDGDVIQSVDKLYAYVWTSYGSELSLGQTEIELKNADGIAISGLLSFVSGPADNPVGNLTFTLQDSLEDGTYTWKIRPVDEFGRYGASHRMTFTINEALPVIYLKSPIETDSNSPGDNLFMTRDQTFELSGWLESRSSIEQSFYQISKGSGFGPTINLNLVNNLFDTTVALDQLEEGQTKSYIIKITARNTDGFEKEFQFNILHDLQPPYPVEIIIE